MDIDVEAAQSVSNESPSSGIPVNDLEAVIPLTSDGPLPMKTAAQRVAEHFSTLSSAVAAAVTALPSNVEIIRELGFALDRNLRQRSCRIFLVMFICLAVAISLFIISGEIGLESNTAVFVVCISLGLAFLFAAFGALFMALTVQSQRRRPTIVAQGHIRYTIRIEGEQWARFLAYFYSAKGRPSRARGWWFCCGRGGSRYQRLLQRGYGHFILGSLGLIVDELFCTTYDHHIVLQVELLPVANGVIREDGVPIIDTMVRVWLCRRLYDSRWPPTPFKVDFFLPPQIPSYEIPGILKFIKMR